MELDKIRLATIDDLSQLCAFYKDVCDHQSQDKFSAKFTWGIYPSKEGLKEFIANAQVLIGIYKQQIVSAGILTIGEEYSEINWPEKFKSNDIGIIHLYAVHPKFRGQGISTLVLQALIKQAKADDLKVIHLDVIGGNIPAAKLYLHQGFKQVAKQIYHYDDIGDCPAILMEYLL